jgi:small-conductance mechanosensitive channel
VINEQVINWSLEDFIARVSTEPTAAKKNEIYDKKILSVDVTHHAAVVKSRVAVGDLIFTDYMTLLKINGHWIIRNKSFTN